MADRRRRGVRRRILNSGGPAASSGRPVRDGGSLANRLRIERREKSAERTQSAPSIEGSKRAARPFEGMRAPRKNVRTDPIPGGRVESPDRPVGAGRARKGARAKPIRPRRVGATYEAEWEGDHARTNPKSAQFDRLNLHPSFNLRRDQVHRRADLGANEPDRVWRRLRGVAAVARADGSGRFRAIEPDPEGTSAGRGTVADGTNPARTNPIPGVPRGTVDGPDPGRDPAT